MAAAGVSSLRTAMVLVPVQQFSAKPGGALLSQRGGLSPDPGRPREGKRTGRNKRQRGANKQNRNSTYPEKSLDTHVGVLSTHPKT